MDRSLLVVIAHGVVTGVVLKVLSLLLPSLIVSYYTSLASLLLCLYVAKATLPLSKKRFLGERVKPEDKAVLITGCDTGFGHHLAMCLDDKGYRVLASCLLPTSAGAESLREVCSERLQILGLDVTKEESVKDALEVVKENLGASKLWAVVNNAGIVKGLSAELSTLDDFRRTFEVNTFGMVRVTNAFLPLLRQHKGRVVNLTSISGRISAPHTTAYTMSKSAAIAFTECLKQEMDPWGVKVISVEPELFQSALTSSSALCQTLDNSLDGLSDRVKEDYGDTYFKDFKTGLENTMYFCSNKTQVVVDALEAAVSLKHPDAIYKPCRNVIIRIVVFFSENLPMIVTDVVAKICLLIIRFPTPRGARSAVK